MSKAKKKRYWLVRDFCSKWDDRVYVLRQGPTLGASAYLTDFHSAMWQRLTGFKLRKWHAQEVKFKELKNGGFSCRPVGIQFRT